jgi:predicted MPP superfamily phosphohydrolase
LSEKGEKIMLKYKQLIFSIIIIIIILILNIISEKITMNDIEQINEKLDSLDKEISEILLDDNEQTSVEEENLDSNKQNNEIQKSIEEKSKSITEKWKKFHKILALYIEHDEIEKVAIKISLIQKQVEIENFGDARQAISEAQFLLEHLKEKQKVSLENIF